MAAVCGAVEMYSIILSLYLSKTSKKTLIITWYNSAAAKRTIKLNQNHSRKRFQQKAEYYKLHEGWIYCRIVVLDSFRYGYQIKRRLCKLTCLQK